MSDTTGTPDATTDAAPASGAVDGAAVSNSATASAATSAVGAVATKNETGGEAATKDTKTLLSDDGGNGAGAEPVDYKFVPPDDIGEIIMTDEVKKQFDSFNERAKVAGLSQEQYQKIVEGEIRRGREAVKEAVADYQKRIDNWADTTRADKELGGADLAKNLSVSKKAMDTYGTPGLKALLDLPSPNNPEGLGLGSHPEIIRLLHRVGTQLLEEGNLMSGESGDAAAHDASLRRMYPSMFKETAARS